MDNKIVCQKCGQIYDADRPQCPLCGAPSGIDAAAPAEKRRRRLSDDDKKALLREEEEFLRAEEGRYRRLKKRGESDAPEDPSDTKIPAGFVVVSILILLAALFIGGSFLLWKNGIVKIPIYDALNSGDKPISVVTTDSLPAPTATLATESAPAETAEAATEVTEPMIELPDYDPDTVILVNEDNPLPEDYEIAELKTLGSGAQVSGVCMEDLQEMMDKCREDGNYPRVFEGYDEDADDTDEYRTGLALDIFYEKDSTRDAESQMESDTILWLQEHAWEYGFIVRYPEGKEDLTGHGFEPWHLRYVGKDVAEFLHDNDLCLEEFNELLMRGTAE